MGIFSRLKDIVNSNLSAMLDAAENPEKLLRLMTQEMEDTLIEIKAQCAGAMAHAKSLERAIADARDRADEWDKRAQLAIEKGREDLAREALLEKRRYITQAESLEGEQIERNAIIDQYKSEISQVEAKMTALQEKQKILVQRHRHARTKLRAQENIRRADSADTFARFDGFERRIDRMEAEADLVNYGRPSDLDKEFEMLEEDKDLDKEMEELRNRVKESRTSKEEQDPAKSVQPE